MCKNPIRGNFIKDMYWQKEAVRGSTALMPLYAGFNSDGGCEICDEINATLSLGHEEN